MRKSDTSLQSIDRYPLLESKILITSSLSLVSSVRKLILPFKTCSARLCRHLAFIRDNPAFRSSSSPIFTRRSGSMPLLSKRTSNLERIALAELLDNCWPITECAKAVSPFAPRSRRQEPTSSIMAASRESHFLSLLTMFIRLV